MTESADLKLMRRVTHLLLCMAAGAATASACSAHNSPPPPSHPPTLDSLVDDTDRHLVERPAIPGEPRPTRNLPWPFGFHTPNDATCRAFSGKVTMGYACRREDRWVLISYIHDGYALGPAKWVDPQHDWHPDINVGEAPVDLPSGHRLTLSEKTESQGSVLVCGVPDPATLLCRLRSDADDTYGVSHPPGPVEHGFVLSSTASANRVW